MYIYNNIQYNNSYVISYYFDSIKSDASGKFINATRKAAEENGVVDSDNLRINTMTALAYSSINLITNV